MKLGRFNLTIYDKKEIENGIRDVAKEEEITLTQAASKLIKEALIARGKIKEELKH